jgi:hypothetical protein
MIQWMFFPRSTRCPELGLAVVSVFEAATHSIDSETKGLTSDQVLARVGPHLSQLGFRVETGKTAAQKVAAPVLFGRNGSLDKSFEADAFHEEAGVVVEVEAGRGVVNNQLLKDLFQACMMHGVRHLAIAVRNTYRGGRDYERVIVFFETLYASDRLQLPLDGILVIGY